MVVTSGETSNIILNTSLFKVVVLGNVHCMYDYKNLYICQCLQCLEQEMDIQVRHFDELNDHGHELVTYLDGNVTAIQHITAQLQEFQERWDNLVQQMEYQSKEVSSNEREYQNNEVSNESTRVVRSVVRVPE